jgi:hypothetical protein
VPISNFFNNSISPLIRGIPVLNNFDVDSSVNVDTVKFIKKVAKACLVGLFD